MPYFSVSTNQSLSPGDETALLADLSRTCAELLGKPEDYVMVRLNLGERLFFAGTDEPAVFGELFSIGLAVSEVPRLSSILCELLKERLAVPAERTYLNFHDAPRELWGWNGRTFAKS